MNKLKRYVYDAAHYTKHKILRRPIVLKAIYDTKTKKPDATVVFLHGIAATSSTWRHTIQQFSKDSELKNVRLLALDLLGFGKSLRPDWLNYNYEDYDRALDRTFKKLHIKSPIILVGHSMGGLIAAHYAAEFPYSANLIGLILVSPPILMSNELARLPDKIYAKSYGSLNKLAKEEPAVEVIGNFVQRLSSFRSDYLTTSAFGKSMDAVILNRQNYRMFSKIKLPTLIIHGRFDPLVMRSNLKRVAEHNRHIRYVGVLGHHDISVAKRAKMLTEIKRLLKEEHVHKVI